MITESEKLIDFEVYKYVFPNLLHLTALMVVLLITVVFCIICLPFIWLVPTRKMFEPLQNLIDELT
jgi:Na+/H+-dicarboxylate symporter